MSIYSRFKNLKRRFKKLWKKSGSIYLVTGADSSHFKSLVQFLKNIQTKIGDDKRFKFIVWDLGLEQNQIHLLHEQFSGFISLRQFHFEQFPNWLNIKINAGEYAWKAQVIKMAMNSDRKKPSYLIWMDSGNLITETVEPLIDFLDQWMIYSPFSRGTIGEWTHPGTLDYLRGKIEPSVAIELRIRNGACLGFKTKNQSVQRLINEFARLSLEKECIAPSGSSRENHRQDQSVFSILYYEFMRKHFNLRAMPQSDEYIGFTIHNDID